MKNILKKALSVILTMIVLLSVMPTTVITYVCAGDTITWNFDGENLVVSGSGELSSTYTSTEEWKNIKDKCVNVTIQGDVTIIGDNAFRDFTALETVEVSSQITKVGEYAFSDCYNLLGITLPDSVTIIDSYAFSGCTALKEFAFPQKLVKINKWAFKGCNCFDNKPLVLPDTLQKLSLGSFYGADITSLTAPFVGVGPIDWEDSGGKGSASVGYMFGNTTFAKSYPCRDGVYGGYYYIPVSLKEVTITKFIYDHNFENAKYIEKVTVKSTVEADCLPTAFAKNCNALKELVIENTDNITLIGSSALDCCYALESFTIPENVTKIGSRAFALCRFKSIEIPGKVETIGAYAFFKCDNIKSVVIPDSVTSIGDYAFCGCTNLKEVKFPSGFYLIGEGAFDETQYTGTEDDFVITENGDLVQYRGNDTEIVVPEGVARIGSAFAGNKSITSIILPDSLLYIEENAFKDCSSLTKIIFPDSLEYISENSFKGCSSLTEINLPDGLSYIPVNAFNGCSSLTEITIPDTVLEIKSDAFNGCCKIKELVVPDTVETIQSRAFAGMCGLEKLTVPFVGRNRDVETDTYEAIIGYWFDSDATYREGACRHSTLESVTQEYNHSSSPYGYSSFRKTYKPRNFKDLTVTSGALRSYALDDFGLEILSVGENVELIEEYAAYNLGLTELHLHEDAKFTEIPDNTFNKNGITSVTIPKNVKRIGAAFSNNQLTEINLNEGLEVIGDYAFQAAKITSIDLPDSLVEIGYHSFFCCSRLEYVEFPENLKEIHGGAFWRAGLKEIVFSESITYIQSAAFHRCPVKKIVIPESLSNITEEIFKECEELEIVVIGGKVEEIGSVAFANCTSLETVVIPDSVTSISEDAFMDSNLDMVIYCNEGSYAETYAIQNNIKYTTLVLDSIPNQTYTGKAIEPEVKAKANNKQLVLNSEYKLSFSDNIDVGVASVTARGLGDFKHLIAKGKFNILARQLKNVTVNYEGFAYYSPNGIKPEVSLYIGEDLLREGNDYEIVGLDKITGVGVYNIAIKGIGNLIGTKNFTLDVLPRSITETRVTSKDGVKVTDSDYTLVEGVDYRLVKRTTETGEMETYVVGIGNYTDEKCVSSTGSSFESNLLYRLFALFEKIIAALRGIFK